MTVTGFVCGPRVYEYQGWTFEVHAMCGPWPLKKDGDPRERAGRVFYNMYSEWSKLTDTEKKETRIGGGCIPIN